eukprot:jgi/Undpi1/2405/HiC_scaffold_13.g05786.m1
MVLPSASSQQWVRAARRRSSTSLFLNRGAGGGGGGAGGGGGQGSGTQQLSRQAKLAISVLIDLIGMSSFALPGIGETTDIGWAPISSALILYLYGNNIFAGLAFVEEILPGFDIIPTATIAWFLTNSEVGQNVTNAASGKAGGPTNKTASSAPPPPPSSDPRADASPATSGSRKVDGNLVQSAPTVTRAHAKRVDCESSPVVLSRNALVVQPYGGIAAQEMELDRRASGAAAGRDPGCRRIRRLET